MNKQTMSKSDNYPMEYTKEYLFGAIKVSAVVADTGSEEVCRKFKHMIRVNILWYKFSCVIRSSSTGGYIINEKEVL